MGEYNEDISTYVGKSFDPSEINEAWLRSASPGDLRYAFADLRSGTRLNIMTLSSVTKDQVLMLTETFTKLASASGNQLKNAETKATVNIFEVPSLNSQVVGESLRQAEMNLVGTKGVIGAYVMIDSSADDRTVITVIDRNAHEKVKAEVMR